MKFDPCMSLLIEILNDRSYVVIGYLQFHLAAVINYNILNFFEIIVVSSIFCSFCSVMVVPVVV